MLFFIQIIDVFEYCRNLNFTTYVLFINLKNVRDSRITIIIIDHIAKVFEKNDISEIYSEWDH